ncbi:hypothetical protein ON010_g18394 [Phytophthora cinnamomi]|nr:hypothetical protein ON010_g18394 [Phytophthora cinnamomi]
MLACKYLQRDEERAASTLPGLASSGSLGLAQQVLLLHSPLADDGGRWKTYWAHAIYEAGTFAVAAKRGHVEAMDFLYKQGLTCRFYAAMRAAIEGGQVSSVKWLLSAYSYDDKFIPKIRAIDKCAEYGHLEILRAFHEWSLSIEAERDKRRRLNRTDSWWSSVKDPMFWAARGGHLEVLKWFQANRVQKCEADTMDVAAEHGHLEVVKWLHLNRSEGCTDEAMGLAASNGHMEVVQWLHCNCPVDFPSNPIPIFMAARYGHFQTVKWLYEKYPTSVSPKVIDRAVRSGHMRIACWLQSRFPENKIGTGVEPYKYLVTVSGLWDSANAFEVVLCLHTCYKYALTKLLVCELRESISDEWQKNLELLARLQHWLDEHYPASS